MSAAFYHDITFTYDAHLCYRVVAHNQYGDGESNELCGDTLSPGLIFDPSKIPSLTPRSRSITLKLPRVHDWSDYILQRAEGDNTSAIDLDSPPIADIPMSGGAGDFILYTDGNLAPNTQYCYAATAMRAGYYPSNALLGCATTPNEIQTLSAVSFLGSVISHVGSSTIPCNTATISWQLNPIALVPNGDGRTTTVTNSEPNVSGQSEQLDDGHGGTFFACVYNVNEVNLKRGTWNITLGFPGGWLASCQKTLDGSFSAIANFTVGLPGCS